MASPEKIYHRGLRKGVDRPNSFESLLNSKPGDALEVDTFLMADGNFAVSHPRDLGITPESAENLKVGDLEAIAAPNRGTHKEEAGQMIPLLQEVFFQACDRGLKLYIELKASTPEKAILAARQLVRYIENLQRQEAFKNDPKFVDEKVILHSFSPEGVEEIVRQRDALGRHWPIVLDWNTSEKYADENAVTQTATSHVAQITGVSDWIEKGMILAVQIGCEGIGVHLSKVIERPEYIDVAHRYGLKIMTGTPEDPKVLKTFLDKGLDMYTGESFK